jgi:hypothetical protein
VPPGLPVRLVEIGASAGLNLLLDRSRTAATTLLQSLERSPTPAAAALQGPRRTGEAAVASELRVVCACRVCGRLSALGAPRAIAKRIGVDLHPVDLEDPEAARWLLACVWPDQPDRVARLRAAIELARSDRPTVVRGDGRALLAELVGPRSDVHPVIWHSWVLAYRSELEQRALADAIDGLGADRNLTWVYLEQPSETAGRPTPELHGAHHDPSDAALVDVSYREGKRTIEQLASAHGHLHHMRWLAAS